MYGTVEANCRNASLIYNVCRGPQQGQAAGGGVLGWNGSVEAEEESVTCYIHCVTRYTLCYT